jgi:hypothetical protein
MSNKDTLQAKREEANKIVNEIIEKSTKLEEGLKESVKLLQSMEDQSGEAKKLNATLRSVIKTTNENHDKLKQERRTLLKSLNEVNNFYDRKFLPLSQKIEDKTNGFQSKISEVQKNTVEVSKMKLLSAEQFKEVKNFADELRKKNKELVNIDASIRKFFDNSKANNQSILEFEKSAAVLEGKIKASDSAIQILFKTSEENSAKIKLLLENSTQEIEMIRANSSESTEILDRIMKIYDLAAETGLSGEFERQKLQLAAQLKKWERNIFWTSLILLLLVVGLFFGELRLNNWILTRDSFDLSFYVRFLLFSPVVYYLYFCASQHSQSKRLHDKYTFKTTLAMSIQNHIKMLLDEEKFDIEARKQILEFVLNGFQKIYAEPYNNDDIKIGLKLSNLEMNLEKKLAAKFDQLQSFSGATIKKVL